MSLVDLLDAHENVYLDTNVFNYEEILNQVTQQEQKIRVPRSVQEEILQATTPPTKHPILDDLRAYDTKHSTQEKKPYFNALVDANESHLLLNDVFKQPTNTQRALEILAGAALYLTWSPEVLNTHTRNNAIDKITGYIANGFSTIDVSEDEVRAHTSNGKQNRYLKKKIRKKEVLQDFVTSRNPANPTAKEFDFHKAYNFTDYDVLAEAITDQGLVITADNDFTKAMYSLQETLAPQQSNKTKSVTIYNCKDDSTTYFEVPNNPRVDARAVKQNVQNLLVQQNKQEAISENELHTQLEKPLSQRIKYPLSAKHKGNQLLSTYVAAPLMGGLGALYCTQALVTAINPEFHEVVQNFDDPATAYGLFAYSTLVGANFMRYAAGKLSDAKNVLKDFKQYQVKLREAHK